MCLRIAIEVARALSYLHSAASQPIYHRDIKSSNILLNDKYRAKVADFGTSRLVAIDQSHVTTLVYGTFGKENRLVDILDTQVRKDGNKHEVMEIANLAQRCLYLYGEKQPTMTEIMMELEGVQKISPDQPNFEELDYVRNEEMGPWNDISILSSSSLEKGYHETRRKEVEAGGRKGVHGKRTDQRVPQTAVKGGAPGGGGEEFQFQNNTPNEGAITGVTEVNANKTNLEGQSFRGGIANQGEYFAEKINEIDKELKKFDLEKGDTRELLSESSPHVPLLSEDPKEATPHVPLTQAKPIAKSGLQDTYAASTWKRIPRVKNVESYEPLSSQTLKRSGVDIEDHEVPRKKQQVSHDDGKTLFYWQRRNKSHFNEPCLSPDKLFDAALRSLVDFQVKKAESSPKLNPSIQKWNPPPVDIYKINYDSSVFTESDEAGLELWFEMKRGRKVMASPLCTASGKAEETTLHALWESEKVQINWDSEFNSLRNLHHHPCSIMDLICRVGNEGKSVEHFSILAWFVWCRRNKSHFNEPCLSPDKLFDAALRSLVDFQVKKAESSTKLNPSIQKWNPPPGMQLSQVIKLKTEECNVCNYFERHDIEFAPMRKKCNY
nr:wall-associated receptor kinase-like 17 [Quercus suber]